jgi:hypothetical protein
VTEQPATDLPADGGRAADDGPGCLPAVMAACVLLGIVAFVSCGASTWFLFQQRSAFAIRTLRGSVIPQVEQGRLQPETKRQALAQLESFAADLERGKYENWQAAGAMSQLILVPLYAWGDVQAIEIFLQAAQTPAQAESLKQLSRLQRAAEVGKANAIDFEEVLAPARVPDPEAATGSRLQQPLSAAAVADVIQRAKLVADRAQVPDQRFETVPLDSLIRDAIEQGVSEGR